MMKFNLVQLHIFLFFKSPSFLLLSRQFFNGCKAICFFLLLLLVSFFKHQSERQQVRMTNSLQIHSEKTRKFKLSLSQLNSYSLRAFVCVCMYLIDFYSFLTVNHIALKYPKYLINKKTYLRHPVTLNTQTYTLVTHKSHMEKPQFTFIQYCAVTDQDCKKEAKYTSPISCCEQSIYYLIWRQLSLMYESS